MAVIIGIILGILYILQPVPGLRGPVEWLNSSLVTYTGVGGDWVLGFFGNSESTRFFALLIAVATPGIAGLVLNLIAPLGRMLRVIFSIGITVISLGSFAAMPWQDALLFSLATTVIGAVLAIASGPIMEAFAAFFSVTLGVSQVRMLLTDKPSPKLQELIDYMGTQVTFLDGDGLRFMCAGLALIPTALIVAWLCWRFAPGRRRMVLVD